MAPSRYQSKPAITMSAAALKLFVPVAECIQTISTSLAGTKRRGYGLNYSANGSLKFAVNEMAKTNSVYFLDFDQILLNLLFTNRSLFDWLGLGSKCKVFTDLEHF